MKRFIFLILFTEIKSAVTILVNPLIEEIIVVGSIWGAVYALLALGFTLIYGVAGVVNLAHGALFMLGAYLFYGFSTQYAKLEPLPALILAVIVVGIVGSILYRVIIHPVVDDLLAVMVITVGLVIIIQQAITFPKPYGFGPAHISVPPLTGLGMTTILGVLVNYSKLLAVGVSAAVITITWIFITKSKIGRAMRATSQDREVAMLMGINTERLYMLAMGISASLAAIAGIFIAGAYTTVATPQMWMEPLSMSFAIVILGGLGSIKGSVIGSFIIAYSENAAAFLIVGGGFLATLVAFSIMVLVLLIRPRGLFGRRVELEE